MRILVCVKQVPNTAQMKVDPVTNTLVRTGSAILNPYDEYALEQAVRLKKTYGGSVSVLTMGPFQAEEALRDCLAVGADNAYLVSDRAFAGSDTLATSYVLSGAIRAAEQKQGAVFDLILCGKQSVDGETGQVGSQLAEHMELPQATLVSGLRVADELLYAERELEDCHEVIAMPLPAVVTVVKSDMEITFPSIKSKLDAMSTDITIFSLKDITLDSDQLGLSGSPTMVSETFVPQTGRSRTLVQECSVQDSVKKLVGLLRADSTL